MVGSAVFECSSCGTLLNEKGEVPKKSSRSGRMKNAYDEDPEFRNGNSGQQASGNKSGRMFFLIAAITGVVVLIFWLFSLK